MNNLVILMAGGNQSAIGQIVPLVLKAGDKILTIGGIYGTIQKMNDDGTIIMAVEDGTKIKISKNAVSQDATSTLNQTV